MLSKALTLFKEAVAVAQAAGISIGHGELFKVIPIVIKDEQAGKPIADIIADAFAVLVPAPKAA